MIIRYIPAELPWFTVDFSSLEDGFYIVYQSVQHGSSAIQVWTVTNKKATVYWLYARHCNVGSLRASVDDYRLNPDWCEGE